MLLLSVKVRNITNGSLSELPAKQWKLMENAHKWRGVFEVLESVYEPPEVTELKKRLSKK